MTKALKYVSTILDAVSQGRKPPFQSLLEFYKYNRIVGYDLRPEKNRCALIISMTLGLEPRPGEFSVQSLGNKELVATLVGPLITLLIEPLKDADIVDRFYVTEQDLAA